MSVQSDWRVWKFPVACLYRVRGWLKRYGNPYADSTLHAKIKLTANNVEILNEIPAEVDLLFTGIE